MNTFSYLAKGFGWICLAFILLTGTSAFAADPQPYEVTIKPSGNSELDQMLKDSCTLISLKDAAPVGSFAMVARARADVERFVEALHSLGYYEGKVNVQIAHRPLDDRGLYDTIDYSPASPPIPIEISIELGKLYHLRTIKLAGKVAAEAVQWLGLKANAPARAADVVKARENLQIALQERGYALAKVGQPVAHLIPETDELDVTFPVRAGKVSAVGDITVKGLKQVNRDFVDKQLVLAKGDPFQISKVEKSRQNLQSTGVFSSVRPRLARALDSHQQIPITFLVSERLRHTVNLGAAYSTDLGGSFSGLWQHHNLLGQGEQLNLTAGMSQLGGNSTTGVGYNFGATFIQPDFLNDNQNLQFNLAAVKQSLITYDQTAIFGEVLLTRKFNALWTGSIGFSPEQTSITQAGDTRDYTLAGFPIGARYDSTDSLLDPTKGSIIAPTITPMISLSGSEVNTFVMLQVPASTYFDCFGDGRSILALRGLLGGIDGAGRFDLPPDKRFYGGGSATVRGYRYQAIGPLFSDGNPQGGKAITTATVEFRQRIYEHYGIVAFTDAGQVSPNSLLASGAWRLGAGLGARYYTGFGPLRVDVAFPLNQQTNSSSFELYLGLGQAF
jgi:translocation and assembly module TamA